MIYSCIINRMLGLLRWETHHVWLNPYFVCFQKWNSYKFDFHCKFHCSLLISSLLLSLYFRKWLINTYIHCTCDYWNPVMRQSPLHLLPPTSNWFPCVTTLCRIYIDDKMIVASTPRINSKLIDQFFSVFKESMSYWEVESIILVPKN